MNKLIAKILKESGVEAKIVNDSKRPKFRVKDGQLTLEGVVTKNDYKMMIKDPKGATIDELSVSISNSNDLVNRINESISTLNKLSPIYDNHIKLKEDEEFEDLPEAEPGDVKGALVQLETIYDELMTLAEKVDGISAYYEDDDAEGKQNIITYVSTIYDLAMDISDYIEDTKAELEAPTEESYKPRTSTKSAVKKALEHITVASATLKGQKDYRDVRDAMNNIKAELTVRGLQ